jgi:hypothetical protein
MAAMVASERADDSFARHVGVVSAPVTGLLAYVHLRAYVAQLRRNVSGVGGDAFDGPWEPPLTAEVQLALYAVLVVVTWLALSRFLLRHRLPNVPAASRDGEAAPARPSAALA